MILLAFVARPELGYAQALEPDQLATRLTDDLNGADPETLLQLFTDDAVVLDVHLTGAAPRLFVGREQVAWWIQQLAHERLQFSAPLRSIQTGSRIGWSAVLSPTAQQASATTALDLDVELEEGRIASLRLLPVVHAVRPSQAHAAASSGAAVPARTASLSSATPNEQGQVLNLGLLLGGGVTSLAVLALTHAPWTVVASAVSRRLSGDNP